MKRLLLPLFLLVFAFTACRKDSLNSTTNIDSPIPTEYTKARIYGVVISEADLPISDAEVTLYTQTGTVTLKTDKNGAYLFPEKTINAKGTYVKVSHPSYFHGSKVVNVRPNSQNQVIIKLLSNKANNTINASTGGTADYGDYSLAIPGGAVVGADGQAYNGQILVAAHYLKPAETGFALLAPGRLEGLTTNGDVTGLISMGQMAVELRKDNGDLLQIKPGAEATLRIKLPASTAALAQATIPMWWFDEQVGIWKEEGNAALNNGWYEAKVSHFTFWNWDFINPSVPIDFKFVDADGNPVTNIWFDVQATVQHTHGSGSPDADGHLIGNVPANEPLVIYVYAHGTNCSSILMFSQPIGPFSAPEQVCLVINAPQNVSEYTVTGTLLDCNGQPVTNGYVRSSNINQISPVDANGQYSIQWNSCQGAPTSITLYGFDITALKESDPMVVPINGTVITAPTITVCQNLSSFLILNTSTGTFTYTDVFASKDSSTTQPNSYYINTDGQSGNDPRISLAVLIDNGLTTYIPNFFSIYDISTPGAVGGYSCDGNCSSMVVTITENGGPGGFIAGTFTGTLPNPIGGTPPFNNTFTGSFRARVW
jgi:hypothetical protein